MHNLEKFTSIQIKSYFSKIAENTWLYKHHLTPLQIVEEDIKEGISMLDQHINGHIHMKTW